MQTRKYLASLLYQRTGGVPRFIGYAVGRNKYLLEVLMLDVLRLYNLWIEKRPSDGQWRIIFPDIVLDETAYFNRRKGTLRSSTVLV
jgi:hypothetical protein